MKNIVIILVLIATTSVLIMFLTLSNTKDATDFSSCIETGNPIIETYPRQCRDQNGNIFVEDIN